MKSTGGLSTGWRTALMIVGGYIALHLLAILFFLPITTFRYSKSESSESRTSLAKQALMPRMADYIERSATRGFQDVELKIETRKFSSTDELVKALSLQKAFESATVQKNGSETLYMLESVTPSEGRSVEVNADTSLIDPNSERIYWTWDYSIVAYKDGSCRFVVLIRPR